ncbi:Sentrin-specific protease 1 [Frankliniella fusca]|uniref:Sentrin-specific protease 1 n=1 Tax=Frankliniella fusca TaxID=407009 RepID=A0AAE1I2U0_9NEOP|nr:Sentrin-specific protease 1 [Frankliniella fusca]
MSEGFTSFRAAVTSLSMVLEISAIVVCVSCGSGRLHHHRKLEGTVSYTMSDISYMSGVDRLDDTVDTDVSVTLRSSQRKRKRPKADLNSPGLIALVAAHPCIWDDEDEDHCDLNAVSQAWEIIAREFYDASAAECMALWKSILKGYNQNLKRHAKQLQGSGLPGKRQKPHIYANLLSFLKKVGNLEDEIVQGPSCLNHLKKQLHTSSPVMDRPNKENQVTPTFSAEISPLKRPASLLSPLRLYNHQTSDSGSLIHEESTLLGSNNIRCKFPFHKSKLIGENKLQLSRLPSIKEESENSRSLTSTNLNGDQALSRDKSKSPVVKKNTQNNGTKLSQAKLRDQKREDQLARIEAQVKKHLDSGKTDIKVKPSQIRKEEKNLNENEIVGKLLEEEDRFMYSVLSVLQPLRSLPLHKSRRVLMSIMKVVFDAEEEVEAAAKVMAQAAAQVNEDKDGWKLSRTISKEDQDLIDHFLEGSPIDKIPETLFNMTVLVMDLESLKPGELVNDVVINYYLALVSSESTRSIFALSTFFFLDLTEKGYECAKKHTQKKDFFNFDLVLVPIHKNMNYWVLAVIDMVERKIRYYDSMNGQYIHCPSILLKFLEQEYETRNNAKLEDFLWSAQHMEVPKQDNGCDCGVFVCKYAECEGRGVPCTFSQANMPTFRKEIMLSIIKGKIFSGLTVHVFLFCMLQQAYIINT